MKEVLLDRASYRPDIDGLRAIAVLAVLIFHAFPDALPGGFVGVDVFFVISGYLITSIILRDVGHQNFSLAHFYAQRVRRIFPALLLVLLFCLGVGWLALTSGEYKQLGRYVAGGAAFLNNFLFWRDAGYFDAAADTKPLLHLWSLAIEEQFYIVWPLLLVLFSRRFAKGKYLKANVLWLIGSLFALSLVLAVRQVQTDTVAAFYSPFSRSWELLAGAVLAALSLSSISLRLRHVLSSLGAMLLVLAYVLIDKHRAFPGLWALLPVLGAGCLIAAGADAVVNRFVLTNRALVWVGLISYPLYLWHVPLLTFARIFEAQTPSVAVRIGLLIASVVLAYATYRWIERPVRLQIQAAQKKRWMLWFLSLSMVAMLFVGYGINRNDGLKFRHFGRLNADANTIVIGADRGLLKRECGLSQIDMVSFEWCLSQNKTTPAHFAIVGDSKAEALYYGLAREAKADEHWMLIGSLTLAEKTTRARVVIERLKKDPNIDWILLSNTLVHTQNTSIPWRQNYSDLIDELTASGKRVMLVLDNPTLPDPNSCIQGDLTSFKWLNHFVYRQANPACRLSLKAHLAETQTHRALFEDLAKTKQGVLLFDMTPMLCDSATDVCTYHEGQNFLYSYGNHISDYASSKIAKDLLLRLR